MFRSPRTFSSQFLIYLLLSWVGLVPVISSAQVVQIISPAPDQRFEVQENVPMTIEVRVEGGRLPLTFAGIELPKGSTLGRNTGAFSWTPGFDQGGTPALTYSLTFTVRDADNQNASVLVTIQVEDVNRPPQWTERPTDQMISENEVVTFTIDAADADGDNLTYLVSDLPQGAGFDPATRVFSWQPTFDQGAISSQPGSQIYGFTFTVADTPKDGERTHTMTITVDNVNRPPQLDILRIHEGEKMEVLGPQTIRVGETLTFEVSATDPDGDPPALTADALPEGANLDSDTGQLSWTPTRDQDGRTHVIIFTAIDPGSLSDTKIVRADVPLTPLSIVNPLPDMAFLVNEGDQLAFTVQAIDGTPPYTLTTDSLPDGAELDAATGEFLWIPSFNQGNTGGMSYPIALTVTDQLATNATAMISIRVNDVNRAPVFEPIPPRESMVGEEMTFEVKATDPDGDALIFSLNNPPSGATIDQNLGVFKWTPTEEQIDVRTIRIRVADGKGSTAIQDVSITVNNVNSPPVFTLTPPQDGTIGEEITFQVEATDPDEDILLFSLSTSPEGATIDQDSGSFAWTPTEAQIGVHTVRVTVTDGKGSTAVQDVSITVNDVNNPPVFIPILAQDGMVGEEMTFQVQATDPDGDTLRFSLNIPPGGATIDQDSGVFTWTPRATQADVQTIRIVVTDGAGSTAVQDVSITIQPPDTVPPTGAIALDGNAQAVGQREVTLLLSADDADGQVEFMAFSNDNQSWSAPRPFAVRATWQLPADDGEKMVYARYTDTAGNTSPPISLVVTLDETPPVIVLDPPVNALAGMAVVLPLTIEDMTLPQATLHYRSGGENAFKTQPVTFESSEIPRVVAGQVTIPAPEVQIDGVVYYIEAEDAVGHQSTFPPQGINGPQGIAVRGGFSQPRPSINLAYNMISVPVTPDIPRLSSYLRRALDDNGWKVFEWNGSENVEVDPNLQPGKAYWFITKERFQFETIGKSVNPAEPVRIPLKLGWNQIGNPFSFPISWSNISVYNPVGAETRSLMDTDTDAELLRTKFWLYEDTTSDDVTNGQYAVNADPTGTLEPWQGYWVKALQPDLELIVSPVSTNEQSTSQAPSARIPAFNPSASHFKLSLFAKAGNAVTSELRLGIASKAQLGYDQLDAEMPPTPFAPVQIFFTDIQQVDNALQSSRYLHNFQPPADQENIWDVTLQATDFDLVTVHVRGVESVPSEFNIYLEDHMTGLRVDLRQRARHDVRPELESRGSERRFKIRITRTQLGMELVDWIPAVSWLLQNYPNPFNPETWIPFRLSRSQETSIIIYDVGGRLVRQLDLGILPAGVYLSRGRAAYWDGRNTGGETVGSGLYFYQLHAGQVAVTRRMVIVK